MKKAPLYLALAATAVSAWTSPSSFLSAAASEQGFPKGSHRLLADASKKTVISGASRLSAVEPAPKQPENYTGAPVLDPSNYFGGAAMGYAAAKAAPQVMAHLFCYCGCDATDHHRHLIDCFTSVHGVDCHICQEEAILGYKLFREGVPLAEIQRQVDEKYSSQYPFQEESNSLKQYKSTRLYKTGGGHATADLPGSNDQKTGGGIALPAATSPKLKPGFQVGDCCHDKR